MRKIILLSLLLWGISFTASAQADSTMKEYVGKYLFPEGSPVTEIDVILENGALSMASAVGTSSLEKTAEDVFTITQFQGTATFKRNEDKKIIGVSINAMGYSLEGTKQETVNTTTVKILNLLKSELEEKNNTINALLNLLNTSK